MAAATGLRFRACDDNRPPDLDQVSAEAVYTERDTAEESVQRGD